MKRETCVADCESGTGFHLRLFQIGNYFRVTVQNPEGRTVFAKALFVTADEALTAVRGYFREQGIEHTGATLVEQARAEIRMSAQEAS